MRILQIHNRYLEAGGEDGVVRRERAMLESRSHEVSYLEFQNPETSLQQARNLALANWNPTSARRAQDEISHFRPDVFHAHNVWYSASPSVLAAARRHAPVVATLHNYRRLCLNALLYREGQPCTDCVGTVPWRGVVRRCYRDSAPASVAIGLFNTVNRYSRSLDRSIDRFLVLSDFAADLTARAGVDPSIIVRHDNFVPDPGPRIAPSTDSDVVCAVGRLSPEKGFDELVRSWNSAAPKGLRLVIVGDGPERERLTALAGPSIEFAGVKDSSEVAALMRSSRSLALPSRSFEGQPLVLLEALAAGLPILVSDQPPLREVVAGTNQVIVEPGGWPDALQQVKEDSWVEAASSSARERYLERFTSEVAAERLEAIYREVTA